LKGSLNHVEIHAADIDAAKAFYKPLLAYFDWKVMAEFPVGFGMADGNGTSLWWFSTQDAHKAAKFNRDATGIGHVGIHVDSKADVDTFYNEYMKPNGIEAQFETPRARADFGGSYYQVMFVDPEGLAVEVFTT
jgi:catechol 2,3-dioxygenase-like lactoylglutathione lyase family enzyme